MVKPLESLHPSIKLIESEDIIEFVEQNPNPILRFSKDGKLTYANDASLPILLHLDEINLGDQVGPKWQEIIQSTLQEGMLKEVQIEEGYSSFNLTFSPLKNLSAVNVYGREISREKQLEKDLLEAERQKTIGATVATYNHELRNALTIAMGSVPQQVSNPKDEKKIQRIHSAHARIKATLDQLEKLTKEGVEFTAYSDDTEMLKIKQQRWEGSKILIVEEDPIVEKFLGEELKERGFELVAAKNGLEALKQMKTIKPDLIISNLKSQEGSKPGMEFLQITKKLSASIPFILISENENSELALKEGASATFSKPPRIESLVEVIEKALSPSKLKATA